MEGIDVYEILVREHQDMLFAYVSSFTDDMALVEDVCQEAFIEGFRHLSDLRRDESYPAWLRTIARHRAYAALRQRKRDLHMSADTMQGIEDVFAAVQRSPGESYHSKVKALRSCFDELPEAMRSCCHLHYFAGQRTSDIALSLGLSLAAILKRLQRAREALADCITRRLSLDPLK